MILSTSLPASHAMAGSPVPTTGAAGPHCPLTRPGGRPTQSAPTWEELLGQR